MTKHEVPPYNEYEKNMLGVEPGKVIDISKKEQAEALEEVEKYTKEITEESITEDEDQIEISDEEAKEALEEVEKYKE